MAKNTFSLSHTFVGAKQAKDNHNEIGELQRQVEQLTAECDRLRQSGNPDTQKLDELRETLAGREIEIPISAIKRNEDQPRQTFSEESIASLARSLEKEGQLVAVLVFQEGEDSILFDGERRWRAASLAKKETLKAIVIPKPEDLHRKVLVGMLEKEDLNALDLAEALIIELSRCGIKTNAPAILNKAVKREEKQMPQVTKVVKGTVEEQRNVLDGLSLQEDERIIFELLLSLKLNPTTANKNIFPTLSYFEDIRNAIRQGLGIDNAKLLQKISPKNLNCSETKAKNLREKLCERVLNEKLSKEATKQLVDEAIANHNPKDKDKIAERQTNKAIKAVNNIVVERITPEKLQEMREALQAKLAEVEAKLS